LSLQVTTILAAGDSLGRATKSGKCEGGSALIPLNILELNIQSSGDFVQPISL
jgi:hypothetical protein